MKKYATQQTKYGSYTPQSFGPYGNRYDLYVSKSSGEQTMETVLCMPNKDISPVQVAEATSAMREKCHCCFAGYAHTINLCNDRLNNK